MANKKGANRTHPIDKNPRLPRFGATAATGKRRQLERDAENAKLELAQERSRYQALLEAERAENGRLMLEVMDLQKASRPVPMILTCPSCSARHIDVAFASKVHHTHACQNCGMCWRPAVVPTVGVQFLPGFHDASLASGKGGAP